jgi:hypothetical protein
MFKNDGLLYLVSNQPKKYSSYNEIGHLFDKLLSEKTGLLYIITATQKPTLTNMFKNKGLLALLKEKGHEVPLQWTPTVFGFSERLNDMIIQRVINFDYANLYQHVMFTPGQSETITNYANDILHDMMEQRREHRLQNNNDIVIIDHMNRII